MLDSRATWHDRPQRGVASGTPAGVDPFSWSLEVDPARGANGSCKKNPEEYEHIIYRLRLYVFFSSPPGLIYARCGGDPDAFKAVPVLLYLQGRGI